MFSSKWTRDFDRRGTVHTRQRWMLESHNLCLHAALLFWPDVHSPIVWSALPNDRCFAMQHITDRSTNSDHAAHFAAPWIAVCGTAGWRLNGGSTILRWYGRRNLSSSWFSHLRISPPVHEQSQNHADKSDHRYHSKSDLCAVGHVLL